MATRKIVPRADNEGGIGTALKRWATAFITAITCTTINALTLAAAAVGFTIAGGTTSKTLTVDETVALTAKLNVSLTDKSCRAWHDAAQTITTATDTYVALNAEYFDTDVIHDLVTNNSRLTCKTAGTYVIVGQISFAYDATGRRMGAIILNHAAFPFEALQQQMAVSVDLERTDLVVSCILQLAVNDYVELLVCQTSGGNLNLLSLAGLSPILSMVRVA